MSEDGWIKVVDCLPGDGFDVLACTVGRVTASPSIMFYDDGDWMGYCGDVIEPTHWMFLPDPPEA